MFTLIFCPIFISTIIISSIIFYFKFKNINNKYINKIELLQNELDKKNKKKIEIKTKAYYEFFRIVRHAYEITKPQSISVFTFVKNNKLKITNIDFVYQIKSDGGDGTIIFTGEYGQVPITNINIISQLYNSNENININISELKKYDNSLYDFLQKKDIQYLCLINIFNKKIKKSKPIGFFTLTYKNDITLKDDTNFVIEQSNKISEYLFNIIN